MIERFARLTIGTSEPVQKIKVLGKPYTREQLAHALREALDGCSPSDAQL